MIIAVEGGSRFVSDFLVDALKFMQDSMKGVLELKRIISEAGAKMAVTPITVDNASNQR